MTMLTKWLGTLESHDRYLRALEVKNNPPPEMLNKMASWDDDENDPSFHPLLEMQGSLGIVTVDGTLLSGTAGWWGMYFGMVGYDDIRNAVVTAIDNGAGHVLVNLTTPGGSSYGLGALAEFLKEVNTQIPITFYADTYVMSAGIWIATSTPRFYAGRTAELGNIGVLLILSEQTQLDKNIGIERSVFRSTPLKGMGNPFEKLTKEMRAEIENNIRRSAELFVEQVAGGTGLSIDFVESHLHNAKTWMGPEALELGLIKKIISFDQLVIDLQEKLSQNRTNSSGVPGPVYVTQNALTGVTMKKPLSTGAPKPSAETPQTDEELMALALGDKEASKKDDEVEDPPKGDQDTTDEEVPNKTVEDDEDDEEPKDKGSEASFSAALKEMTNELVASTKERAELSVQVAKLEARVATLESLETQFRTLTIATIQRYMAGAGGAVTPEEDLEKLDSTALIAQHSVARSTFTARWAAPGQHSQNVVEKTDEETERAEAAAKQTEDILRPLSKIFND